MVIHHKYDRPKPQTIRVHPTTNTHLLSTNIQFILTSGLHSALGQHHLVYFDLSAHGRTHFNPQHWIFVSYGLALARVRECPSLPTSFLDKAEPRLLTKRKATHAAKKSCILVSPAKNQRRGQRQMRMNRPQLRGFCAVRKPQVSPPATHRSRGCRARP
jgi:hypothetical protein